MQLSLVHKKQHKNTKKHRSNRTTSKNILNMQQKNNKNPFRPANASQSQPSSAQTSRQPSNNSSAANSNYGSSKRPQNYNLDVNELYESILQTQRSQLSGFNIPLKQFNNSQKHINFKELKKNLDKKQL